MLLIKKTSVTDTDTDTDTDITVVNILSVCA